MYIEDRLGIRAICNPRNIFGTHKLWNQILGHPILNLE